MGQLHLLAGSALTPKDAEKLFQRKAKELHDLANQMVGEFGYELVTLHLEAWPVGVVDAVAASSGETEPDTSSSYRLIHGRRTVVVGDTRNK